jgi:hypothetical protein
LIFLAGTALLVFLLLLRILAPLAVLLIPHRILARILPLLTGLIHIPLTFMRFGILFLGLHALLLRSHDAPPFGFRHLASDVM